MRTIIVLYCNIAGHWQAWFDGNPCIAYNGESSMQAIYRVLEGHGTPACDLELRFDQDDGTAALMKATWRPPALLLRCEDCNGTGEYVGLMRRETCARCAGTGFVAA